MDGVSGTSGKVVSLIKSLLGRRVVTDSLVILVLIAVVLGSDIVAALAISLLAFFELPFIRRERYQSLKNNFFIYLIPSAYVINVARSNAIQDTHVLLVVISLSVLIAAIIYDAIVRKLTHRYIYAMGVNKSEKKRKMLDGAPMDLWFYLFLAGSLLALLSPQAASALFGIIIVLVIGGLIPVVLAKLSGRDSDESNIEDIRKYSPKFVVYFSVGQSSQGIYTMWDKYLKMVGENFIIVTPQKHHIEPLSKLTDVPVVYYNSARYLERILDIDSIKAVFYPANSPSNMLSMTSLHQYHVLLLHGDSDKASSYRLVSAGHDRLFVAGQAAIDRYKDHGVNVSSDKFVIVGRPQVEDIEPASGNIKTVLYAPTWHGNIAEMDYSSLYKGPEIVQMLLDNNLRVIFRPHPHSRTSQVLSDAMDRIYSMLEDNSRKTGLSHIYGEQAEQTLTVNDCFNKSDMMISDVSSVISDYLYSEKPMILVSMRDTVDDFVKHYPTSAAGYIVEKNLEGMPQTISDLLDGKDDLAVKRKALREHYLSSAPAGKSYSDLFVSNVRKVLDTPNNREN